MPRGWVDWWLDATALAGILLSTLVLVLGRSNMLINAALWMLYHSIVNVGQVNYFYSQWMNDIGIIGRYSLTLMVGAWMSRVFAYYLVA